MVKLFIVGFPKDMDEGELLEICSNYGVVDMVKVVTDKETGISKSYGFLFMNDTGGAADC
jgi:RNA recognition motif-containing protein